METMRLRGPRRSPRSVVALGATVFVLLVTVAACRQLPIGGPTAKIGNDVANCAQLQPSSVAPCGPQPMFWASIAGPYDAFANGDPYATKCGRNLAVSPVACSSGPYPGGATNSLYDATGYEYAIDVKPADVGRLLTLQVWDAGAVPRTTGPTVASDCATTLAPFNAAPYAGVVSPANCQTGDSGTAPFQVQVFDNDGEDLKVSYSTPKPGCELFVDGGAAAVPYKNTWTTVCSVTPTQVGVFPVRIKSSNITRPNGTVVPDTGDGANSYALRLNGSTVSSLHGLDALSINANTPSSDTRFYLTEVKPQEAGKRLVVEVFDPGDGTAEESSVQILGPPSGAPNLVPTTGTVVPSVGLADLCRYNSTVSATRGPSLPDSAINCRVITRSGGVNRYENGWLRIEIAISPNYTCTTDCWWTVRYNSTVGSAPTDRMVWAASIVDPPAAP